MGSNAVAKHYPLPALLTPNTPFDLGTVASQLLLLNQIQLLLLFP